MGAVMRAFTACVLFLLASVAAFAQTPPVNYFYCYAADPDTRTVYLSQTHPVGPLAERSKYGEEFVAYLRAQNTVKQRIQGHCVMRATADEIARAQIALSKEDCSNCLGATAFTSVYWPRINTPNTPAPPSEAALKPVTPPPGVVTPPEAPAQDPLLRVVVMGNDVTGEVIVGQGGFNLEQVTAERAAKSFPQTGWRKLLASEQTGFGVAACVDDGKINFFVAHGKETLGEAALSAYDAAKPLALKAGKRPFVCKRWHVASVADMNASDAAPDTAMLDLLSGLLRQHFACDMSKDADCTKKIRTRFTAVGVRG